MEYTVQRLAELAGVSGRTIRYYDQIGLLKPTRISSSGYRIYGQDQVDALQQILFYRELDLELSEIQRAMQDPKFDRDAALERHRRALAARRDRLDALIATIDHTLSNHREGTPMSDKQKFEGFKQQLIDENERKYGAEIREQYGEEAVNASNRKMMNLTKEQYDAMQQAAADVQLRIEAAVQAGIDPSGEEGKAVTALHKQWLGYTWPQYTPEAHKGLAQMYIDDERFTAHYDKDVKGCAQWLRDAVHQHA